MRQFCGPNCFLKLERMTHLVFRGAHLASPLYASEEVACRLAKATDLLTGGNYDSVTNLSIESTSLNFHIDLEDEITVGIEEL